MPTCNVCVYGTCGSVKSRDPDVTFHRFPNDPATRLIWIERCSNKKLESLTPKQLENNRVCSRHFSPHDFQKYGRQGKRKIKPFSIPNDGTFGTEPRAFESSHDPPLHTPNDITLSSKELVPIVNEPAIDITTVSKNQVDAIVTTVSTDLSLQHVNNDLHPLIDDDPNRPPSSAMIPNRRISRKKGVSTVTPIETEQDRLVKSLRRKLKVSQQKIRRMKAAEEKNSSLVAFAKAIKSLHSSQQAFIDMQIEHQKKIPWSEADKQFALTLFYVSPKAYTHLRDKIHFALPSVAVIRQWINALKLTTGISQGVFDRLATKAESMTDHKRDCVLMWDEVSLEKLLEYDAKFDQVEGFEDLGELGRTDKLASHALTFMLRGLKYSWKQPIAYVLSHSSVRNEDLTKLILQVIDKVHSIGLVIKATVCDQGATNRTALASLGVTVEKPFMIVGSRKIFVIYDVPHLMKSVRNNLVGKKVFLIDGDEISWEPISQLRDLERDRACKVAPKLTDKHINPNSFDKMTVSLATQVFSGSVSAALSAAHLTGEIQHPHCSATANFCKRMNDLFDCLNSRRVTDPNPLKRALSSSQPQVQEYLESCLSWIEKWTVAGSDSTLPCVSGFIMTIRSVLQLWDDLYKTGSLYFITSRVNQDPIENLFSILRGRGGYNPCPSALNFRRNLQYAMTANLMKPSSSTNCESDDAMALLPMLVNRGQNEGLASGENIDFRQEINALVNQDCIVARPVQDDDRTDEIEHDPDFGTSEIISNDEWTAPETIEPFSNAESLIHSNIAEDHSIIVDETIDFGNEHDFGVDQEPVVGGSTDESVADNRIEAVCSIESNPSLETCTLENCAKIYVGGYLAFKCLEKFNCSDCRVALTKSNQNYENSNELLIFWKAYRCKENFELGKLKAPTEEFNKVTAIMYSVFTEVFSSEPHRVKLHKHLETCIRNALSEKLADFWCIEGPCREHREYIVQHFVRVHVFNKLKWISRDLRDRGKAYKTTKSTKSKKRPAGSYGGVKPNAKLKKITHQ